MAKGAVILVAALNAAFAVWFVTTGNGASAAICVFGAVLCSLVAVGNRS